VVMLLLSGSLSRPNKTGRSLNATVRRRMGLDITPLGDMPWAVGVTIRKFGYERHVTPARKANEGPEVFGILLCFFC